MGKHVSVAQSPLTTPNYTEFDYTSLEEAFPAVDPGVKPFGFMGIFQIRHPKRVTKGGILLVGETEKTEHYNTQVAKVISLGPLAFKSVKEVPTPLGALPIDGRSTVDVLVDWPEGHWFKPGDYVRVPKYGGDRFWVPFEQRFHDPGTDETYSSKDQVIFAFFQVKNILGLIADPLSVMAYLD